MKSKSINVMALIRLYSLKADARRKAVTDRAGGGGPSPYRHALKALDSHLHGGVTREDAEKALTALKDEALSAASVDIFLRAVHFLAPFKGKAIDPLDGSFWSPDNVFQIKARSHIAIETEKEIVSVQFWNNKTADFYSLPAQIASSLYKDAISSDLIKPIRYVFHNLRTGKTYEFEVVTQEARRARRELIFEIERLLTRATRIRLPEMSEERTSEEPKRATRH